MDELYQFIYVQYKYTIVFIKRYKLDKNLNTVSKANS